MSKLGPISHFPSPVSCDSLVLHGLRSEWGAGVLNPELSLLHSLILVTGSSTWHLMAKNSPRVKVMDWPNMSPDLNLIERLWGILKQKAEERNGSNIHQLRDVIMEEWKRIPVATCEALYYFTLYQSVISSVFSHEKI